MAGSPASLSFRLALLALAGLFAVPGWATELRLKDGRIVSGKLGMVSTIGEMPKPQDGSGGGPLQLIVLLDDDLRRTFLPKRQVQEVAQEPGQARERFNIPQRVQRSGRVVKSVGPAIRVQPFDEYGRRIYTMNTVQGPLDIIQGITEITPEWTKVEGISHMWDMRVATSSIPHETLNKILLGQINPKDIEQRKKIARFYIQAERYEEAARELEGILADFTSNPAAKEQVAPTLLALRQMAAQRFLNELKLRRDAGQHQLVLSSLEHFPSEGVAGEVLQAVREMVDSYRAMQTQRKAVIAKIDELLAKLDDSALRGQFQPIRDEIAAELGFSTLSRMAAFMQHADDAELRLPERLALAVTGWLLGSDAATLKPQAALSAYRVRKMVLDYLGEPIKLNRARLFGEMASQEGAAAEIVAAMLGAMKPPLATPAQEGQKPGHYVLEVPGMAGLPAVPYRVQLPPEYDPYHRYPTIVTLHGPGINTETQVDWWAGAPGKNGQRMGQATRYSYIVIAPEWTTEHQREYEFSAREHAAVLNCLRDACRRFSVDTDRVYLSGHSMGGNAAWDIGLAHPDLWAGVIPIVAQVDRYCSLYWRNAELVPYYFVCGELDGNKLAVNARDFDRYMTRGYNVTVVEYLGRGHEDYYDEIQRLFDWMNRLRRNFYPKEFTCATMRSWDNFFWWVELASLPKNATVEPSDWPPPRGTQAVQVTGMVNTNNGLSVRTGSGMINVWLSPKLVDLRRRVNVVVNGRRLSAEAATTANLDVLLEDARTRADRQNPFWARVEMSTGRGG
jgi:predicted esterase